MSPSSQVKLTTAMVLYLGSGAGSSAFLASSMALASEFQQDGQVRDPVHGSSGTQRPSVSIICMNLHTWLTTLGLQAYNASA